MSFKSIIDKIWGEAVSLVEKALGYAKQTGLTDELVKVALVWVRVAADKFVSDGEKREFVVEILVNKGVPESTARIAVEFAFKLFQKELSRLPSATE